jgi:hypothetical protein
MKGKFFPVLLLGIIMVSCNPNKVEIEGKIESAETGDKVFIEKMMVTENKLMDSVVLGEDNKFGFNLVVEGPEFFFLHIPRGKTITLLVSPGEKPVVHADAARNTYKVTGSKESMLIANLYNQLYKTREKLDSITEIYNQVAEKNDADSLLAQLNADFKEHLEEQRKYTIQFLLKNYTSLASIVALYQEVYPGTYVLNRGRDLQFFKITADSLQKYYPRNPHVQALVKHKNEMLSNFNKQKLDKMIRETPSSLPGITLPDKNNNPVSLLSLKDKYIILSFWNSRQKESLLYNLDLREIYKEYNQKGLEVYQVALEESRERWLRHLESATVPWISVIDTASARSEYAAKYNLDKIPVSFVIKPDENEILGKFYDGEKLKARLRNIYQR